MIEILDGHGIFGFRFKNRILRGNGILESFLFLFSKKQCLSLRLELAASMQEAGYGTQAAEADGWHNIAKLLRSCYHEADLNIKRSNEISAALELAQAGNGACGLGRAWGENIFCSGGDPNDVCLDAFAAQPLSPHVIPRPSQHSQLPLILFSEIS